MQAEVYRLGKDLGLVPEVKTAINKLTLWAERNTCAGTVAKWLSSSEPNDGSRARAVRPFLQADSRL